MSEPISALDATPDPRFAGLGAYARIPDIRSVSDYDIAVLGVPFDGGTSYRPGAGSGRWASAKPHVTSARSSTWSSTRRPWSSSRWWTRGDVPCTPYSIDEAVQQIEDFARDVVGQGDPRIITLGGDHTVALPMLRAAREKHGPVALIHFDAHLDTWDTYFNAPLTHGTVFRRASEEGLWRRTSRSTSGSAARSRQARPRRRPQLRLPDHPGR